MIKKIAIILKICFGTRKRPIFVNESGLCFNIHPRYGLSLRGTSHIESNTESKNYSVLMTIDNYRVLSYLIFMKGVKSEDIAFL